METLKLNIYPTVYDCFQKIAPFYQKTHCCPKGIAANNFLSPYSTLGLIF